jgi:hypothetical protein
MKKKHNGKWLEEKIQDFLDAPTKREAIEVIGFQIMEIVELLMDLENVDKSTSKREYISDRVSDLKGAVTSKTNTKKTRTECQKSKGAWTAVKLFSDLFFDQLLMTDREVGKVLGSDALLNAFPNSKHHCFHGVGVELLENLDLWMDRYEGESSLVAATEDAKP